MSNKSDKNLRSLTKEQLWGISQFFKKNEELLTAVGVFGALTAFLANLGVGRFAIASSLGLFILAGITLLIESRDNDSFGMILFQLLFGFLILGIVKYTYNQYTIEFLNAMQFIVYFVGIAIGTFSILTTLKIFKDSRKYSFLIVCFFIGLFGLNYLKNFSPFSIVSNTTLNNIFFREVISLQGGILSSALVIPIMYILDHK